MDLTQEPGLSGFSIAACLKKAGHTAYFAGGCVRDFLMGRAAVDIDIATTARPEEVEKLFPKTIPVGRQFGVMIVVERGRSFEEATFRREGGYYDGRHPSEISFTVPEEDARRRDFTINGLFYDPFEKKILDYAGGQADLPKKLIRAIGDPRERFEEDKLRLLRAIRFASSLDFEIEAKTWEAIQEKAAKIAEVSPERIREELVKIFTRPNAARGFKLLSDSGLMKMILPEVEAMKGCEQPPEYHPEGDVFVHTALLLEKMGEPSPLLALSAVFHDVGKPVTFSLKDGRIKFYEHAPIGADMTRKIMKRLRFSNDEIEAVSECVANHMKFADVQKMRSGKLKQFVSRPTFPVELELHKIDCQSSHGKLDNYQFLQKKIVEYAAEDLKPKPLINGNDLIALGMKPGPEMKPFLEEVYTLQLEGGFKDREECLAWAQKRLQKKA